MSDVTDVTGQTGTNPGITDIPTTKYANQDKPGQTGPDLNALLRETMGAARQMAAATPKRWPPESGALVLLGAAGALVAGVVPGIGEPLRLAGIGAGAFVVALIGAARHGKRD